MKRNILNFAMLMVFAMSNMLCYSQTLQNGDFENWSGHTETSVQGWHDNNVYKPVANFYVTKVPGVTNHAVRLETKGAGLPISGSIYNFKTKLDDGGAPYTGSGIPTRFKGHYRCAIAKDSATIYVTLKKNGIVISNDTFYIWGTQAAFTPFEFVLSPITAIPDTVIFHAVGGSFNPVTFQTNAVAGDYIELDEMSFSDGSNAYPFPNGDFDTWTTKTVETLNNWNANAGASKTTDKVSGSYALKLTTKDNGTGSEHGKLYGSTILLGNTIDTLTGYYKYSSPGGDKGIINIMFWNHNGGGDAESKGFLMPAAANYVAFAIPLENDINASDFNFYISSGYDANFVNGNILYIDNLQIKKGKPTSVISVNGTGVLSLSPVPCSDVLRIAINNTAGARNIFYTIVDMNGKIMKKGMLENGEVDIHELTNGIYNCIVMSNGQVFSGRIIVAQ